MAPINIIRKGDSRGLVLGCWHYWLEKINRLVWTSTREPGAGYHVFFGILPLSISSSRYNSFHSPGRVRWALGNFSIPSSVGDLIGKYSSLSLINIWLSLPSVVTNRYFPPSLHGLSSYQWTSTRTWLAEEIPLTGNSSLLETMPMYLFSSRTFGFIINAK